MSKIDTRDGQYHVATPSPTTPDAESRAQRYAEARALSFGLEPCADCGHLALVRNGTCFRCLTCGGTSGCS